MGRTTWYYVYNSIVVVCSISICSIRNALCVRTYIMSIYNKQTKRPIDADHAAGVTDPKRKKGGAAAVTDY